MPTTLLSKLTAGAAVLATCTAVAACRTARTPDPLADKCVTSEALVDGAPSVIATQGGGCKSPTRAATFPATWRFKAGEQGTFAPAAMVASNNALASAAGDEIMKAGGNAVDGAVATGFALAVTFPFAGNLGGGGYMVIRMADGRTAAVDYREIAPLAASRDMYIGPDGKLTNESVVGYRASGVPGAVAGMTAALAKVRQQAAARSTAARDQAGRGRLHRR
jgi:gamma-glutamyltranspeptidase/glutathione hydrolase